MVDITCWPYLQWNILNNSTTGSALLITPWQTARQITRRLPNERSKSMHHIASRYKPLMTFRRDPAAEFRDYFGDTVEFEKPMVLLVRDKLNRDPKFTNSYIPIECREKFYILKGNKFSRRSAFLREEIEKAESSSSDSNTPKQIILENHNPEDFDAYLRYVNTGNPDSAADDNDPLFPLLRLYVLADQLRDSTIANFVMSDIIRASDKFDHTPSKKEIWFVWTMIEEYDHPLKRLFVDYQIHEAPRDSLIFDEIENIPFEYLNDVVLEFWDLAKQEEERRRVDGHDAIFGVKCSERPGCHYHQHDVDENHLSCEELGITVKWEAVSEWTGIGITQPFGGALG